MMAETIKAITTLATSGAVPKLAFKEAVMELTWVIVPIPKRATRTPATAKKLASGRHFSPIPFKM